MAKTGKGLLAVEEYARRKEQEALKIYGESQTALQQGQQQLQDLIRFREEYQEKMLEKGLQSTRAAVLQHFRRFIEQLDQVITQQRTRNQELEGELKKKCQLWLQTRNDKKRYEKLRERQRHEANARALLEEQTILDDHAGRRS